MLPWVGPAYSRACEYTCDRAGCHVVGDLEQATRGLVVLAAGGRLAQQADLGEFIAQQERTGLFWMSIYELVSSHPYLCKRAAALREFVQPGTARVAARHPLAYPLAPVFGMAAGPAGGGLLMMILVMGFLSAFAIPKFMKMQEKALHSQAVNRMHPSSVRPSPHSSDSATTEEEASQNP
jgi:hypothetical protein